MAKSINPTEAAGRARLRSAVARVNELLRSDMRLAHDGKKYWVEQRVEDRVIPWCPVMPARDLWCYLAGFLTALESKHAQ